MLFQRLSHNSLHAAELFIPLIPSVIAIVIVVMIVLVIVMMVLVIIMMVMPVPFRLTLQSLSSPLSLLLSSSLGVPAGLYSSALRDSPSWLRISAWGDDPSRAASRIARMASSSNVRIPSRTLFEKYLTLLFVSLRGPCHCWSRVVSISDSRVATSENSRSDKCRPRRASAAFAGCVV